MRLSLIYLTLLSLFFAYVASSPVVVRAPAKAVLSVKVRGPTPKGKALQRAPQGAAQLHKSHPSKGIKKQPGAACARRASKRPRDLDFDYFDRRGDLNDKELDYEIATTKLTGGSYGEIYEVISNPKLLAKKNTARPGVRGQTLVEFKKEAENLGRVGQFVDWGHKTDCETKERVYYIIMKKVSGTPFPKTSEFTATAGNKAKRKSLVDKVAGMVADKMLEYIKHGGVWHGDANGSNVMCTEQNQKIVAVDLVDWGLVYNDGVIPEAARHQITKDFALQAAKSALEKMYI